MVYYKGGKPPVIINDPQCLLCLWPPPVAVRQALRESVWRKLRSARAPVQGVSYCHRFSRGRWQKVWVRWYLREAGGSRRDPGTPRPFGVHPTPANPFCQWVEATLRVDG